ncbi:hypothetical protein QBC38DRAFT_108490 [Podospora fimiseda]|uniref:BZIP domain-containing protein n=1 Tax=Podospora fimiseda TaxID=252190 RepID=A0AAN7H528_9PEZI|nr:hypothetical protein QBC38DRAFT_108490 [Podospora fimiseda]
MSGQEPHSEPPKPSKRKGTRSVSSLTPSQLARKRANDREAQRAIRLRTKEHIERLERELAEYKSGRTQDEWTKLIKRNKELETEVIAMREVLNHLQHNRYPPTAFETDGLPNVGGHTLARAPSFGQGVGDYTSASAPGYPASYLPTPEPCAEWPVSIPTMPVQSNGSSPNSSAGHNEEGTYAQVEYPMPTSIPPMMGVVMPPTSMAGSIPASMAASIPPQLDPSTADQLKYEDMEAAAADNQGYPNPNMSQQSAAASYLQQSHGWAHPVYSAGPGYYTTAPAGQTAAI